MTIHRWSGIGDGRYGPSEIKRIVSNNVKFTDVLTRVKNTDVLVVDEVSMMSKRFLESLNEVCSLKNETLFFGGLQVILVGDFLQLAPVPCARYNEDGCYCFESDVFNQAFPHVTILTEVVRQNERDMIKAIREISIGVVSDETIKLLKELQRPLQDETIKLFSTNDLVDDYNRDRILDFPGQIHEKISIDTGDKKYLKEQTAPRNLWLKIGIPVMLIKNLSDQLVNGLRGTVYDIQEDGKVLVEFPNMKEATYIEKVRFEGKYK
jgi:ATP-dependent exoDNAse (exonuclease V) alpha subunit